MTEPPEPDAIAPDSSAPKADLRLVLTDLLAEPPNIQGQFRTLWPGVDILPLYGFDDNGEPLSVERPTAALLRYAPGASVPLHAHRGVEHILVLSGSQQDELAEYPKGSLVVNPPGTRHSVSSTEGCLVLAIWTKSVEVV